jgi:hypothetical protein
VSGFVAKLKCVAGPVAAARVEQIGRVAVNKLVAGERIPAKKAQSVACLEPESGLAVFDDRISSYGFDGFGVFVDAYIQPMPAASRASRHRRGEGVQHFEQFASVAVLADHLFAVNLGQPAPRGSAQ